VNGYQFVIPLSSKETVDNPTQQEARNINFFKSLRDKLVEFMVDNHEALPETYQAVDETSAATPSLLFHSSNNEVATH
jgi:hypothetical protein